MYYRTSIFIPNAPNEIRIYLNFILPVQNDLQLGVSGSNLLYRNNGATFLMILVLLLVYFIKCFLPLLWIIIISFMIGKLKGNHNANLIPVDAF